MTDEAQHEALADRLPPLELRSVSLFSMSLDVVESLPSSKAGEVEGKLVCQTETEDRFIEGPPPRVVATIDTSIRGFMGRDTEIDTSKSQVDEEMVFFVRCRHDLTYTLPEGEHWDEDRSHAFRLSKEAEHSAWPFIRELVHNLTQRTPIQGVLLPTLQR